ncbi:MAG: F0F1 ATP synthase subunit A [Anaerolineae bacterium]|nr:F0F1 ATP synthase subunit A [Anaerolineae bacterium]
MSHGHDDHGHAASSGAVNPVALKGCLYLLVGLGVAALACVVFPYILLPEIGWGIAVPVITIFGEPLIKDTFLGIKLTNTLIGLVLVDIIILFIGLALRKPQPVPKGFQGGFELIVDYLYGVTKNVVGPKDARKIFPLIATFFIVVLTANWTKLLPGFETIGALHCAESSDLVTMSGYPIHAEDEDLPFEGSIFSNIYLLKVEGGLKAGDKATPEGYEECEAKYFGVVHAEEEAHDEETVATEGETPTGEGENAEATAENGEGETTEATAEGGEGAAEEEEHVYSEAADRLVVTPFLRGAATDLNFTLALAIIAMFAVQYYGVQKLGLGYFSKFVNLPALGNMSKKPMGLMDFVVGLLEVLSEVSKIISFAFRLFGVIFAGGILLIVATFLTGALAPAAVYGIEFFIGAIQAFVFFILPLVLINLAMVSHHGDDH